MIKVAQVKFTPWDKPYDFKIENFDVVVGNKVLVKTDLGTDVGDVVNIYEVEKQGQDENLKSIIRLLTTDDLNKLRECLNNKIEAIEYCKKAAEKYNLDMKIVDGHYSFDGGRLTFAFIAEGRIDFRQLVRDLTHHFQKSIRLHQIGIRDEAKISGDFGSCGRKLCCRSFLKELGNITSELAEKQEVSHRGSDRLSGICGRLRCCLAYEKELYERLASNLPAMGTILVTKQGKGEVIGWHTLRQTVDVKIANTKEDAEHFTIIEVDPKHT